MSGSREKAQAVFFSLIMVVSMMAIGGAALASSAAAQQGGGDSVTLLNNSGSEVDTYGNLGSAIDNANADYTIILSAGDYNLNSDIGTEGLTIEGPNADVSGTSDTRNDEANVTFDGNINANNVTIDGILYEEDSNRVQIDGANVTISNTVVEVPDGTAPVRLGADADDAVITNNEFDGLGGNWVINSRQNQNQLLDGVTITNNVFQNAGDGVVQANGWINAEISGNTFTDLDADAVRLASNVTGTDITNNVIRNTGQDPDNLLTTGIFLNSVEGDVEISDNEFENNPYHIVSFGNSDEPVIENNEFDKRVEVTAANSADNFIAGEIQAAVDDAAENSIVSVAPGTYNESVSITTSNVTLTSTDGASATTINATGSGDAVNISTQGATVSGFTIVTDTIGVDVGVDADEGTGIVVTQNNIVDVNEGVNATDGSGTVDATSNWWGSADGPSGEGTGNGASVSTSVAFEPFYLNPDRTVLSNENNLSVGSLESQEDFAGIVADDENITVTASGIAADGYTLGNATVNISVVRKSGVYVTASNVTVDNGTAQIDFPLSANGTGDVQGFPADTETGTAEIVIEQARDDAANGTIELVHEANSLSGGFTLISVPQPASVQAQNVSSLTSWDPTAQNYTTITDGTFDTPTELHRGIYVDGKNDEARIGFDYVTEDSGTITPGIVELQDGWQLASSNFDASSQGGNRSLATDINPVLDEDTGISVQAGDQSGLLSSDDTIDTYETYWVFVDDTATGTTRGTLAPEYNATARATILND